ncbi:metallophosphatase [Phormidium sp. CCY1219]|uniref:metallophosphatase n=1 Tax=Phormidium sp. CCY1219 TaxID=2886104 RepID=UPI002D1F3372|nr:metallophosphatase [Phormidium sp. CCY1219]MEB3831822.1 metallophosphatase [Phormidium sp. CCY1219]
MNWAILSGIEGNLAAYEAVLSDIHRQNNSVENLYIIGDVVGPHPDCDRLVKRIINPRSGERQPQVCQGWWEEQCLILHGLGRTGEPTQLIEGFGYPTVKLLWDSVSRSTLQWIRSLEFGFLELDCLLIHGSTLGVDDEITPDTSPLVILDRLMRIGANSLFCGRSGLTFQYQIESAAVRDTLASLNRSEAESTVMQTNPRQAIGVGRVGRIPGQATYTLFNPNSGGIEFKTVYYGPRKGFSSPLVA